MNDLSRLRAKLEECLEKTGLKHPQVEVFKDEFYSTFIRILSFSFSEMSDAERQELAWQLLFDNFDERDRRLIKFIYTETPSEYAKAFGAEALAEFGAESPVQ